MTVRHNHLDQQRRDRGECEACDLLWAAQAERTKANSHAAKAERSIQQLVNREVALADRRYGNRAARDD